MTCRVRAGLVVLLLALTAGCADEPQPSELAAAERERTCTETVQALLGTTQRYLQGLSADADADADRPVLGEAEYSDAVSDLEQYAARSGCPREDFQAALDTGFEGLEAPGALAGAVLAQLRAGPAQGAPRTVSAAPGDDLTRLTASLPTGSTVELAPGHYQLDEALVLLRGITLHGGSRDTTSLVSPSADGVLLVLTGDPVTVRSLELRREGATPGAVVQAAATARLAIEDARVAGGRADATGAAGAGVLLAQRAPEDGPDGQEPLERPTALSVVRTELVDNQSAGVVAAGAHRVQLTESVVSGAGQCGVCFLGDSDGRLDRTTLTDNQVGLLAADRARPALVDSVVRGGTIGVQVAGSSAAVVQGNQLVGPERAAYLATDTAGGRFDGNTCVDAPAGVVVGPSAVPFVGDNSGCALTRGQ